MIAGIGYALRRVRFLISRSEWAIRHFGLQPTTAAANRPGLALIQIDGLSYTQMQRAMSRGRLPFLKSLIDKQTYRPIRLFSGLPSSTPAAQAELFYGVKHAVPAFCFYDRTCGRIFSMFEGDDAREMEKRLKEQGGEPLLKGGSAYADIYSGGASEAHLCMTKYGWPDILRQSSPPMVAVLVLLHIPSLIRILFLLVIEFLVAIADLFRGLLAREDFRAELKFVPSRVLVCIVMREIIVLRACMDLQRGLPIVHMNFLGYDEQAHRRGPDSEFAHWSLKGIDRAVERVYKAAQRSLRRDYDVWIYSDHGQANVESYQKRTGETVQAAVSRVFDQSFSVLPGYGKGAQLERARLISVKRHRPETQPPDRLPIVTGVGPLGSIYLGKPISMSEREVMARRLVEDASIPLVATHDGKNGATVWTARGRFRLPADSAEVLGADHPYLEEAARDLVAVCHHPDAGEYIIGGWAAGADSLSFPVENGSHGGYTPEETSAFAILPEDAPLEAGAETIRLKHIREATQRFLTVRIAGSKPTEPPPPTERLRVLTYNVHSCAGRDGFVSPHRIARVIEREEPDVIALQEVDVGRERTELEDQAELLACYLGMHVHFHPAMSIEKELYGDAILSRYPMKLHRADALPYRRHWLVDEPRGALWVEIDLGAGRSVQLFNTHLGLGRAERKEQAEALLGPGWLGAEACRGPVVFCGDLNSSPGSQVHRRLESELRDVQTAITGHKRLKTFLGQHPFGSIDHVMVNDGVEVLSVTVPNNHLSRVASDHLPLVVDVMVHSLERGAADEARCIA